MSGRTLLKYWWRSGSLRFARDADPAARTRARGVHVWHGKPIHYRPGTSDTELIYKVLLKSGANAEYAVPDWLKPQVIFDIGANIGTASIYFAHHFPNARICAFEPVPENVELLRLNTAGYPNVTVFPVALGTSDGTVEIFGSDNPLNFGGFSFYEAGSTSNRKVRVQRRNVKELLREQGIDRVDLIKIDAEGAEHEILTAFAQDILSQSQWITGELHGEKDFDLLAYLSQWFDIAAKRSMGKRLFMFAGANKSYAEKI